MIHLHGKVTGYFYQSERVAYPVLAIEYKPEDSWASFKAQLDKQFHLPQYNTVNVYELTQHSTGTKLYIEFTGVLILIGFSVIS